MNLKFRWGVVGVVLIGALFFIVPLKNSIRLGLDLQGGMHLLMSVDTDKALESRVDSIVYQLRRELQRENIPFAYVQKAPQYSVRIGFTAGAKTADIVKQAQRFQLTQQADSADSITFELDSASIDRVRTQAVSQSLEVIRNRIDEFGVSEPLIQRQGKDQIIVQLPGETDPERAIKLIGQTAQLRFYLVDENVPPAQLVGDNPTIPYDDILLYSKELDKATGKVLSATPMALKREVLLTGDSLMDATVQYSQYNDPVVAFRFDPAGARIFADVTRSNVGKRLAIVLDDNIYSAPNIREAITGGEGSISGRFTIETAQDLAIVLRAGSLPAPVEILENRTVGPSLGLDSIHAGVKASIIGLVLIMLFMAIYYKSSGIVANVGLVCNFVVLLGALCASGATLTLPGIAGVILTLGIAVDANVLIFERIREELKNKRTVLNAFETGYDKAFTTIIDANVTSLIAAVVLFQFGTGPVKGFAVTLSLGLIASMFTAVYVTKTIFMTFIIKNKDVQSISI
ncbi:protein translocase subunit SecD [Deferribacterales bacterium RsTz2092]|nr:protein translocase subunit SecD [Deferribacterales bacterium]